MAKIPQEVIHVSRTRQNPDELLRLECLKLAVELHKDPRFRFDPALSVPTNLENSCNALLRYVKTGMMAEPVPVKTRYRAVELTHEQMELRGQMAMSFSNPDVPAA
jgi:hypothetical protein